MFHCQRETTERDEGKIFFIYLITLWLPSVCVQVRVFFTTNKLKTLKMEVCCFYCSEKHHHQQKDDDHQPFSYICGHASPSQALELIATLNSSYFPASCFTQKQVQPASKIGADPFLPFLYLNRALCISVSKECRPRE